MINRQKCAVIGCGFVGSTSAYTLMQSGLFSEMVLLDANRAKAEGEAMDINHGMPFGKPARIYAGGYADLSDCCLIIIAAGANQKPGETRTDLVHKNTAIFRQIIRETVAVNKECVLLVVTNPVDILTYVTWKLSGFPSERVIGSGTVLDTARFKYMVGEQLGIDYRDISAFIIGEHGDTELAVWSAANISGIPVEHFCDDCGKCVDQELMQKIFEDVRNSGYNIIERKGATYFAVALAVLRIAEALTRGESSVLTVSTAVNGHYGLPDICLGLPSVVTQNGIKQILDIPLSDEERRALTHSGNTMRAIIDNIAL